VVLDSIKKNDFDGALEAWKKQWDRCVRFWGADFEGEASQNQVS
jgi:hypothetical protein